MPCKKPDLGAQLKNALDRFRVGGGYADLEFDPAFLDAMEDLYAPGYSAGAIPAIARLMLKIAEQEPLRVKRDPGLTEGGYRPEVYKTSEKYRRMHRAFAAHFALAALRVKDPDGGMAEGLAEGLAERGTEGNLAFRLRALYCQAQRTS
jgi:hypothetical protein